MLLVKERIREFLKKYGMDAASVDMEENLKIFTDEMQRGLEYGDSSLLMLPTYISMEKELPLMEPIIAIDAGGTNFRAAVVHFDPDKKVVIEDYVNYRMPGIDGEISGEEFFDIMAGYIGPIMDQSNKIGFCFSYALKMLPEKDGRLIKFSKEMKVRDVEGELIGAHLLKAIRKCGCSGKKSIVLLNDTVATLLAGKSANPERVFDSYMGLILGTGMNICYDEKCANIGKVPELKNSPGTMLINTESGTYSKAPRGVIDLEFDSKTENPGSYAFEKAISGAYQGGLIAAAIKKAADEGLFSSGVAAALGSIKEISAREVDEFLYYPCGDNPLAVSCKAGTQVDYMTAYYLIDELLERAARFVVFALTAILEKTGKGRNPCVPACITVDGSTFYKSKLLRGKIDHYIKIYSNDVKGIYSEFVKVDEGTLVGAAIAGLIN